MTPIRTRRTGARSGSSQLVAQAVYIQAHQTARNMTRVLQRAGERVMVQQIVRQLGDREDEHQVEEQLQGTDAVIDPFAGIAKMGETRHQRIRRISHPKRKPCC